MLFLTTVSECCMSVSSIASLLRLSSLSSKTLFRRMKFHGGFQLVVVCLAWMSSVSPFLLFFAFTFFSSVRYFCSPKAPPLKMDVTNWLLRVINAQIMWKYRKLISLIFHDETADVYNIAKASNQLHLPYARFSDRIMCQKKFC